MTRWHAAAALASAASLLTAPYASADPAPQWDGWYEVTFHTDQKTGTSAAASQREEAYTAWYKFATDCSSGTCTASVVDGPTPKDNVPKTTSFTWNGTQWTRSESWRWDCLLPDRTITYDTASSVTNYSPQSDGSLKGTFGTNIGDGDCQGTVYIPLTAVPADPGTDGTEIT
ncbi:MAG TPA: hypothetical protein PKK01_00760 [Mycobacterium sp.]|nr:MAG: hypothetical protein E6Q56_11540 [Mycobacterium sp.]HOB47834.1 hypothetical protein [Mycobacterium sp.]HPZ94267.1 hypothetical protein [Mycobacterium sp.]HQE13708.1 hypothetical protein [Mycobacterium sp.]